jgi:hypothetical protein
VESRKIKVVVVHFRFNRMAEAPTPQSEAQTPHVPEILAGVFQKFGPVLLILAPPVGGGQA